MEPPNMPYIRAHPEMRWEYMEDNVRSEQAQDVIDAKVDTFADLVTYITNRVDAGDEQFGGRGTYQQKAGKIYNSLIQSAYIYMNDTRTVPADEKYNVLNAIRRRQRDYAPKAKPKAAPARARQEPASGSRG